MKIAEVKVNRILMKSKLPDTDYVVNPYIGCQFGCLYCYASFMGRFVGESINNWGNYLYVKANAVEVFIHDLQKLPMEKKHSSILLSSVTDPYLGAEKKYRLTRGILEVLAQEAYPGLISILTKSPLVLRDIEILHRLSNVEVGLTVTTTDDKMGRWLETKAPPASVRLRTLKRLNSEGIRTYAFVGPLLPHFQYQPNLLDELFARLAESNVHSLYVEHINLSRYIQERLWEKLKDEPEQIQALYRKANSPEHRTFLNSIVNGLVKKYGFELKLGKVLYHNER